MRVGQAFLLLYDITSRSSFDEVPLIRYTAIVASTTLVSLLLTFQGLDLSYQGHGRRADRSVRQQSRSRGSKVA
jgi:hypothetical protein